MTTFTRSNTELFGVSDAVAGTAYTPITRSNTELFGVSDAVAGTAYTPIARSNTELFGVSDAVDYSRVFVRSNTEDFGVSDSVGGKNPEAIYRQYGQNLVTYFETTIVSKDHGDLQIPVSSINIRSNFPYGNGGWQSFSYDYVTVFCPDYSYAEAIRTRDDGQIKIEIVQTYDGAEVVREVITETNFNQIVVNSYKGAGSAGIEISGTSKILVHDAGSLVGEITTYNPVRRDNKNGLLEFTFKHVDPYLRPAWVFNVNDDEGILCQQRQIQITSSSITVTVTESEQGYD
jgi:hypothetical protein